MKKNKTARATKAAPHLLPPGSTTGQQDTELIAALAYAIWEKAGRPTGHDMEHWLQAEAQLRLHFMPESAVSPPITMRQTTQ